MKGRRTRFYRRDGTPYTGPDAWREWTKDSENRDIKMVDHTVLKTGYLVSTIWLGLDHQWGSGPPLIFETRVFCGEQPISTHRYSTEAEARAGHAQMIDLYSNAEPCRPISGRPEDSHRPKRPH